MVNLLSLSPGRNLETSMVRVSRKKRPSQKFVLINLTPPYPQYQCWSRSDPEKDYNKKRPCMLGASRLTPSTLKFGGWGTRVNFVCESPDGRFLRETRWKILCLNPWNSLLEFVFVWVHIREHVGPHTYIHIHKLFLYSDSLSIYIYINICSYATDYGLHRIVPAVRIARAS